AGEEIAAEPQGRDAAPMRRKAGVDEQRGSDEQRPEDDGESQAVAHLVERGKRGLEALVLELDEEPAAAGLAQELAQVAGRRDEQPGRLPAGLEQGLDPA